MRTPVKHRFGFKAWLPTIGLAVAAFVFNTSEFLPVGLLPNIAESLHETDSQTGLVITVYAWVVALMSLPLTVLTAKLERRKLLLALLAIFAASHFVVLWVNDFVQLMGARILVAFTHSIFWSIMTPLAARTAPLGKGASGLAAVSGGTIAATILGVPLGTQLGFITGWREAFFIVGMGALLVLIYVFFILPECKSDRAGSLKSLPILFRRPGLVQLYVLTAVVILGQFTAYSYISPILIHEGGLTESAAVSVLFVFGTAGIAGIIAGAKTAVKYKSATLVLPMLAMTLCLSLLTPLASHWILLLTLCAFWGASMSLFSLALQTTLLRFASDAADVATALSSGIFNIGIGGGALLGSHVSLLFGFGAVGYVGAALIFICAVPCLFLWIATGNCMLGGEPASEHSPFV